MGVVIISLVVMYIAYLATFKEEFDHEDLEKSMLMAVAIGAVTLVVTGLTMK